MGLKELYLTMVEMLPTRLHFASLAPPLTGYCERKGMPQESGSSLCLPQLSTSRVWCQNWLESYEKHLIMSFASNPVEHLMLIDSSDFYQSSMVYPSHFWLSSLRAAKIC